MKWTTILFVAIAATALLLAGCSQEPSVVKKSESTPTQEQASSDLSEDDYNDFENTDDFEELETSSEELGLDGFEDLDY